MSKPRTGWRIPVNQPINQSIFNVLGGNWDPTDKKSSSVNLYISGLEDSYSRHIHDHMGSYQSEMTELVNCPHKW